jgi:hypothetical protein
MRNKKKCTTCRKKPIKKRNFKKKRIPKKKRTSINNKIAQFYKKPAIKVPKVVAPVVKEFAKIVNPVLPKATKMDVG